jgi:hypothetical protein
MMNYVEILVTHTLTPSHGCAEENQKQAPGKMFDKLEKFIGVWRLLQLLS